MPRKAEGDQPLSTSERQARHRVRRAARDAQRDEALDRILSAKTLREAHQIAREAKLNQHKAPKNK